MKSDVFLKINDIEKILEHEYIFNRSDIDSIVCELNTLKNKINSLYDLKSNGNY